MAGIRFDRARCRCMQPLEQVFDRIGVSPELALGGVLALLVCIAAVWLRRRLRRLPATAVPAVEPAVGPALELYHLPMRLAAVVIAPLGRGAQPPIAAELPALVDQIIPGLAAVFQAHHPLAQVWPAQLSAQGFANTFFIQAPLPGDKGKRTPWCAAGDQKFSAGLVLRAATNNALSQFSLERESQWIDLLRVRLTRDA